MYCGMFNSILDLYPLDAREIIPLLPVVITKNVSGRCLVSPVGQNCSQQRTICPRPGVNQLLACVPDLASSIGTWSCPFFYRLSPAAFMLQQQS